MIISGKIDLPLIITFESGMDSIGKRTQSNLLYNRLRDDGYDVELLSFPMYQSISSFFVQYFLTNKFMNDYIHLDFPDNQSDISNPYAIALFFAIDRYLTLYNKNLDMYDIIIIDRYVESNIIYQSSRFDNLHEKYNFILWVTDFEYNKLKLPTPDLIFYLDVDNFDVNMQLLNKKPNKDTNESNLEYLKTVFLNGKQLCDEYEWLRIKCDNNNTLRDKMDIHNEIYNIVKSYL